jgi:hypothetical protein
MGIRYIKVEMESRTFQVDRPKRIGLFLKSFSGGRRLTLFQFFAKLLEGKEKQTKSIKIHEISRKV